ncbi:hypothetical protein ADH66_06065 [Acutalibacter muris]|uniref:Uncharacterized protein n=1 Tax=Acutalibacter muris TaxID=1796620 RepID=A0ABN5A0L1_9FIRM|nr:hypothetical protein ADH66_06065 [Acutalibacter muris]
MVSGEVILCVLDMTWWLDRFTHLFWISCQGAIFFLVIVPVVWQYHILWAGMCKIMKSDVSQKKVQPSEREG